MILMAPCIKDFIGANALLGPVGGGGPGHNSMGPTQQYGPWIHLIYLYIKIHIY
jgi:hypothetical protein